MLREVRDDDVPVFFEQQQDPEANLMAAFPARDREEFMAHWEKIRVDPTNVLRTIVVDERVAGNVLSFLSKGEREVGFWLGREHWGGGIATRALSEFLTHETRRPLLAAVAPHNTGSLRVLEKNGFRRTGEDDGMLILRLDEPATPRPDHP